MLCQASSTVSAAHLMTAVVTPPQAAAWLVHRLRQMTRMLQVPIASYHSARHGITSCIWMVSSWHYNYSANAGLCTCRRAHSSIIHSFIYYYGYRYAVLHRFNSWKGIICIATCIIYFHNAPWTSFLPTLSAVTTYQCRKAQPPVPCLHVYYRECYPSLIHTIQYIGWLHTVKSAHNQMYHNIIMYAMQH